MRLSWSLSAPLGERMYYVYRCTGISTCVRVAVTSNPLFADSNLVSRQKYTYYVTAVNALGVESDPSLVVEVTPL